MKMKPEYHFNYDTVTSMFVFWKVNSLMVFVLIEMNCLKAHYIKKSQYISILQTQYLQLR